MPAAAGTDPAEQAPDRGGDPDDALLDAVKPLSRMGYHIALDDYQEDPRWQPFLPYIHIIKFDLRSMSWERIERRGALLGLPETTLLDS